jgi:hypothetical protein
MSLRRTFLTAVLTTAAIVALVARAPAAPFTQPTGITGTSPSGLQWSAVATGTALPIRTTTTGTVGGAYNGGPGAVAYFNTLTGQLQIDPKGVDISLYNFTYGTGTGNIVASTPGPFTYSTGTGNPGGVSGPTGVNNQRTIPAGTWATNTTFASRVASTVSLTQSPTLATTGDVGNIASTNGWFNQPWSFPLDLVNSGSVASMVNNNFYTVGITPGQSANANLLGYGNFRSTFNYTVNGIVGQQVGAVIPVVPEPSTVALAGIGAASVGYSVVRRRKNVARKIG